MAALVTVITGVFVAPAVAAPIDLQSVQQAFDQLPATPNTSWGIDPATGREVLTISDAAPAAGIDRLLATAGRFGDRVVVRHAHGVFSEQILGGDQMSNGQISCSAGFNVTRGDQSYVITAGHCTKDFGTWRGIGPSVASNFPGTDFGLVRNDTGDGRGLVDRYDGTTQPITKVGTATMGEHVCASGTATGLTCGTVTGLNQTVDFGNGEVVRGLIETNVHTDHGDSGGPLFDGDVGLGTVSGGDGTTDFFQPLAPVLATYGVALAG